MITGEIVDENTSVTKDIIILDGIKNISRYYIRAKELKIEEVKQIISVNESPTETELLTEFDARVLLKKQLHAWGRNRIRQIQYEKAINLGMNIQTWEDIGHTWQKDGSLKNQEWMFHIMHGVFQMDENWDKGKTWSEQLEDEFMKEYHLEYDTPEPLRKASRKRIPSGIEEIIKSDRSELNKLLNLRTRTMSSHGKKIVLIARVGKCPNKPNGY